MKKSLILLAMLGVLRPTPAAELPPKPAEVRPVPYVRALPASVRNLMPRGSVRAFWGTFQLRPHGELYGVQLFKGNLRQGQQPEKFWLALFQLRHGSKSTWQQINRLEMKYPASACAPSVFGLHFIWLDKTTRIPLLKFRVVGYGEHGPIGDEIAIVFPNGLRRPAIVQSWKFGGAIFSYTCGHENLWSIRDKQGFIRVVSTEVIVPGEDDRDATINGHSEIWTWQKNKFGLIRTFDVRNKDWTDGGDLKPKAIPD